MTQIIFQAIVACCCIYTVYRLSLFIFRRLFKGRKSGKDVRDVSSVLMAMGMMMLPK